MTQSQLPTEDEAVFGYNAWVYCSQHLKPHLTGWCGVSNDDKLGLGLFGQDNAKRAKEKCIRLGLQVASYQEQLK